eukprot:3734965-Amphidinium_carterae.1
MQRCTVSTLFFPNARNKNTTPNGRKSQLLSNLKCFRQKGTQNTPATQTLKDDDFGSRMTC